ATGRYVTFYSAASNLVEGDLNGSADVFVHDLETGKTVAASQASDGTLASSPNPTCRSGAAGPAGLWCSSLPSRHAFSNDERYVSFYGYASNLVPNDTNFGPPDSSGMDVFVHDLKTRRTERVSVDSHGGEEVAESCCGGISGSGRFIHYRRGSFASRFDVIVYDRDTGAMEWVTHSANEDSISSDISDDGRFLSLSSWADNLVAHDTNDQPDVFLYDRGPNLGFGGLGGPQSGAEPPDDDRLCIEGVCIPPGASIAFEDRLADVDDSAAARGANLIGGSIASRPALADLYAVLELESMPRTPALAAATAGLVYGMSFEVDGDAYEVRIASTGIGSHGETTSAFGLFDCSGELLCTKLADLEGGFGTTGERIVFSLPLDSLDLESGSSISKVRVFTALGSLLHGSTETIDETRL
ncbi:MAG: hypothetical protein ACRDLB_05930, partial [Actinomycetota bacterium]